MVADSAKLPGIDSSSFARLIWPVGILLVEATALTPFVEFRSGGMAVLAHPLMLSAGIVTLAAFFLLVISTPHRVDSAESSDAEPTERPQNAFIYWFDQPWRTVKLKLIAVHLVLVGGFAWLSLMIQSKSELNGISYVLPALWFTLGIGLTYTLFCAFLPLRQVMQLVRKHTLQASIAGVIGISLLLLVTPMRDLWTTVDGPMLVVLEEMFSLYPGNARIDTVSYHWPIIGAASISLLVTPPCTELESLLVFLLLGGTLWVAKWDELSPWRFLLVLLCGLISIYVLLILRLYFLVLIGHLASDPYVSVGLAHSRVSTLALLIFSLLVISIGSKLSVPPEPEEFDPEQYADEELDEEESAEHAEELATNDA